MPKARNEAAGANALIAPGTPVSGMKGVGPKKRTLLESLGIRKVEDLLRNYPRTYEDRRNRVKIAALRAGQPAAFLADVRSVSRRPAYYARGRKTPFVILAGDETGAVEIVFFNANYLDRVLTPGRTFLFFGVPQQKGGQLQLVHPDFERAADDDLFAAHRIMPVYRLVSGVSQKDMRRWHESALPAADGVEEYLPASIVADEHLCGIAYALKNIHYPEDKGTLSSAKYRLIFEELLALQTGLMRLKLGRESGCGGTAKRAPVSAADFEQLLPFDFTGAQRRVACEVYADMEKDKPMNRLVQGDVGSGKTAVAAAAVYKAARSGFQSVLMAPTEILARQHYEGLAKLFDGILNVALLTAGTGAAKRRDMLEGLADGGVDLAVGTHALLQPDVAFSRLGLVITDEQHRFGVNQRIVLAQKGEGDAVPDVLVMTATPIPRTLAFILYGDLDMSVIDEMPPGRRRIETRAVNSGKRGRVYDFVGDEIAAGRQAYVVAPLIEDNDGNAMAGLRSAESLHTELSKRFKDRRVALLHGAMKLGEKSAVMRDFVEGAIDALVSTVVIEVGIDVPNATVMVIENAERFGLAQLHQLRGRVGRGGAQSYCILVSDSDSDEAVMRAQTMIETDDGFVIAEKDLSMRGPGEMFGVRQHGVPPLRIADLARHIRVAEKSKAAAERLLREDPLLVKPENRAFGDRVEALFRDVSEVGL